MATVCEALQRESHGHLVDVRCLPDIGIMTLIIEYGKEVRNLERRMAELVARDTAGRESRQTAPGRLER